MLQRFILFWSFHKISLVQCPIIRLVIFDTSNYIITGPTNSKLNKMILDINLPSGLFLDISIPRHGFADVRDLEPLSPVNSVFKSHRSPYAWAMVRRRLIWGNGGRGVCLGDGQTEAFPEVIWAWRVWRLPERWQDGGRRSTVAGWTRRRAAPAYAPIPNLTSPNQRTMVRQKD